MDQTCPRCQATVAEGSVYCPMCGMSLHADASIAPRSPARPDLSQQDFTPIPGVSSQPDMRIRKRRRRRTPWYRRARVLAPLLMVAMLLLVLATGAWYIKTRFDTLNQLSTPPAEVSGARLGGEEDLSIDTGPAQDAIREAEARREAARDGQPAPTSTPGSTAMGKAGDGARTAPAATSAFPSEASGRQSMPPAMGTTPAGERQGGGDATTQLPTGVGQTTVQAPDDGVATEGATTTVAATSSGDERRFGPTSTVQAADGPTRSVASGQSTVLAGNQAAPPSERASAAEDGHIAESPLPEAIAGDSYAFLMMGVDARPGEPIDIGVRPDSLFVVYLDGADGSCRVLSIPRDTRVELPGYGQSKINHALGVAGVPYQRLVVENLLGIELAHYGLIDFAGVKSLVDGVGGVTVVNDEPFTMAGHEFPVGTLELNGEQALAYSRYRGGADGDFGRQERQQAVVRAILTQNADLDVVTEIPRLLGTVEDHVRTDLGLQEMVGIAQDFRATCTGQTLQTSRIEGTVTTAYDDLLQQNLSFVVVEPDEVERKVAWLLSGETPQE